MQSIHNHTINFKSLTFNLLIASLFVSICHQLFSLFCFGILPTRICSKQGFPPFFPHFLGQRPQGGCFIQQDEFVGLFTCLFFLFQKLLALSIRPRGPLVRLQVLKTLFCFQFHQNSTTAQQIRRARLSVTNAVFFPFSFFISSTLSSHQFFFASIAIISLFMVFPISLPDFQSLSQKKRKKDIKQLKNKKKA